MATIQEEAFWSLQAPIGRVAAPDTPYPPGTIEELYVPSVERVLDAHPRRAGGLSGAVEFRLPDVGEGIATAEIVAWQVAEGDRVREHQDLVEIQTDKATVVHPVPGRRASSRACAASRATRSTWARCWP